MRRYPWYAPPMLARLKGYFFPERLVALPNLRRFVSGNASYVAQRSTYEFTRNTLAWFGQHNFGDARFNEVFAVCRWEAFAAIADNMTVVLRHALAAHNSDMRLDPALVRLYSDVLAEYPDPAHRPDGWADKRDGLLAYFAATAPDHAPDLAALGRRTGALIHDAAPAKTGNAGEERSVLANAVTFGLVSFDDRLRRLLDDAAVARELSAGA